MTVSKNDLKVILKIFRKAYYKKETAPSGDKWQSDAMRRIRNLGPIQSRKSIWIPFEQFFWRLVPAVCLMIIFLATVLYKMEVVPDFSVFQGLMNGEGELTISLRLGG